MLVKQNWKSVARTNFTVRVAVIVLISIPVLVSMVYILVG